MMCFALCFASYVIFLTFYLSSQEFLDRRKMTEFGSLALVDEGAGDGDGVELSLPGVRRGEGSLLNVPLKCNFIIIEFISHVMMDSGY